MKIGQGETTRQDKTRQDKTRQDKTRQGKTRQDKTRQDKTRQDNACGGDKARQEKTSHDRRPTQKKDTNAKGKRKKKKNFGPCTVSHRLTCPCCHISLFTCFMYRKRKVIYLFSLVLCIAKTKRWTLSWPWTNPGLFVVVRGETGCSGLGWGLG
jgi:hypothetical protein